LIDDHCAVVSDRTLRILFPCCIEKSRRKNHDPNIAVTIIEFAVSASFLHSDYFSIVVSVTAVEECRTRSSSTAAAAAAAT
jgi:hypothetical protein